MEVGGVLFLLLDREKDCSGNDGAGKLFWGIQNLSSCCFLVAIKFFSHFIGKCHDANMLSALSEINGRKPVIQCAKTT